MRNIELDSQTSLSHVLNELKNTSEDGLELSKLPNEKTTIDNSLHRAIIEKVADFYKKEVIIPAEDIVQAPEVEGDEIGFVEGEDILNKTPMEEVKERLQPANVSTQELKPKRNSFFKFPSKIKSKPLIFVTVLFLIVSLIFGSFILLPSATIDITLASKSKDHQIALVASGSVKELDLEKKEIPLVTSEVTKTSSDQIQTTGKKTIGTYSTGRVTIYNSDDEEKNFVKGSILTPTNGSEATFKLNEDVVLEKPPLFGDKVSKGVQVTAVSAGEDGNLPAKTRFKVGSVSDPLVYAENDLAFSGGSTKQANVASSEDRQALKEKLIEKISQEAEEEVKTKVKGSLVLEGGIETTVTKETYEPKNIDAEAENLKATITVQAKANLVSEKDLKELIVSSLEETEKDFQVSESNLVLSAQQTENSNGSLKILGKAKVQLIPEVSETEIKKNMTGKSLGEVKKYLDREQNISEYSVNLKPSFMRVFGFLPFSGNKIKINFK